MSLFPLQFLLLLEKYAAEDVPEHMLELVFENAAVPKGGQDVLLVLFVDAHEIVVQAFRYASLSVVGA